MSVASDRSEIGQPAHPTTRSADTVPAPVSETCPLCGGPLDHEQEWCLRCGAAARTRLAASSNWKAPVVALAVVTTLSLGVLAASVVKLAGGFGDSTAPPATATVTTPPTAVTSPGTAVTPTAAPRPTTPAATTPTPAAAPGTLSKAPIVTLPSGLAPTTLAIKDLIAGTGPEAKAGETVTVNYVGVLFYGGREFVSSWSRHKRFTFTLGRNQVIPGWEKGVPGMRVGGRRELSIPAELAYGAKGVATAVPIPTNAPLVFVVDLREISRGVGASFPFYGEASTAPAPASGATGPPVRAPHP